MLIRVESSLASPSFSAPEVVLAGSRRLAMVQRHAHGTPPERVRQKSLRESVVKGQPQAQRPLPPRRPPLSAISTVVSTGGCGVNGKQAVDPTLGSPVLRIAPELAAGSSSIPCTAGCSPYHPRLRSRRRDRW